MHFSHLLGSWHTESWEASFVDTDTLHAWDADVLAPAISSVQPREAVKVDEHMMQPSQMLCKL